MRGSLLLLFYFLLLCPVAFSLTYEGDSVYIDDYNTFINVTPAVRNGPGWVVVEVETKHFSGPVNVVMGINSDTTKPHSVQKYNPRNISVERSYTCMGEYEYTLNPNYFSCYVNDSLVMSGSFDRGNLAEKTVYWNITVFKKWQDVSVNPTKINYLHDGLDTWYIVQGLNVEAGVKKKYRLFVEMPYSKIGEKAEVLKYDLAFYPSSYNFNIGAAIGNGHFYLIDPYTAGTNGLVNYWDFNSDAKDRHGSNDGNVITATHDTVEYLNGGGSYYYDGNDLIEIDNELVSSDTSFSFSCWARVTGGSHSACLSLGYAGVVGAIIYFPTTAGDSISFYMVDDAEYTPLYTYANSIQDQWTHIVLTYDSLTKIGVSYVNGTIVDNDTRTDAYEMSNSSEYGAIGGYVSSAGGTKRDDMVGNIDEVSIWDRVLTHGEIISLYEDEMNYTDILATGNSAPTVNITLPLNNSNVTIPFNITWSSDDAENDSLVGNVTLYNNSVVYEWVENITDGDNNITYNGLSEGVFNLTVLLCENNTGELYCSNDTVLINISAAPFVMGHVGLDCYGNDEPYYFINGFDYLCNSSVDNYSCVGYLSYNEQVIQTVPERKILEQGDEYNRFVALDHNVIISFTRHNLRDAEEVNLSIECWNDAANMYYNTSVTPYLAEPYLFDSVLSWSVENPVGIVSFFALLALISVVGWIAYAYIKS